MPVLVDAGWVNRAASLDSWVRARPSGPLPARSAVLGRPHRDADAVDGEVKHVRRRVARPRRDQGAAQDRLGLFGVRGARGRASRIGRAFHPLSGQGDPSQVGEPCGGLGERHGCARAGGHRLQAG